jgi:hypothetical protein
MDYIMALVQRPQIMRQPYCCFHHAIRTAIRTMARATVIQFWNVAPKSVKRAASQLPTRVPKSYEKAILGKLHG